MVVLSRLVTRQLTWFRDNAMFKWVNAADGEKSVLSTILSELELPKHQGNLSRFMMLLLLLAFGHSVLCFLMRTRVVQSSTPIKAILMSRAYRCLFRWLRRLREADA